MLLLLLRLMPLLVCLSPSALGELGEVGDEVEPDLSDFDLDIVSCSWSGWGFFFTHSGVRSSSFNERFVCAQAPRRVPRQVKTILAKVRSGFLRGQRVVRHQIWPQVRV